MDLDALRAESSSAQHIKTAPIAATAGQCTPRFVLCTIFCGESLSFSTMGCMAAGTVGVRRVAAIHQHATPQHDMVIALRLSSLCALWPDLQRSNPVALLSPLREVGRLLSGTQGPVP
jgi:hypothetical protein